MTAQDLAGVARAMGAPGKGILTAGESAPTVRKRRALALSGSDCPEMEAA